MRRSIAKPAPLPTHGCSTSQIPFLWILSGRILEVERTHEVRRLQSYLAAVEIGCECTVSGRCYPNR